MGKAMKLGVFIYNFSAADIRPNEHIINNFVGEHFFYLFFSTPVQWFDFPKSGN